MTDDLIAERVDLGLGYEVTRVRAIPHEERQTIRNSILQNRNENEHEEAEPKTRASMFAQLLTHLKNGTIKEEPLLPFFFRYVNLPTVLNYFAWKVNFSQPEVDKLTEITNEKDLGKGLGFAKKSKELKKNKEFDDFVSYRWNGGWFRIWSSLLLHYNFNGAIFMPLIPAILLWIGLSFVKNPCNTKFPPKYYFEYDDSGECYEGMWWFSDYFFTAVSFFLFYTFGYFAYFNRKLFVDRFCIHQDDYDVQLQQIRKLEDFLSRSKNLICIVDDIYLKRIWTMFELAMYVKCRKNPKVKLVESYKACTVHLSMIAQFVVQIIFVSFTYQAGTDDQAVCWVGTKEARQFAMRDNPDLHCKHARHQDRVSRFWVILPFFVFMCAIVLYNARWHIFASDQNFKQAENFDVRECECERTEDKDLILFQIDQKWRDEEIEEIDEDQEDSPLLQQRISNESAQVVSQEYCGDLPPPSKGIHRFNLYVRGILTQRMSQNFLQRWNLYPYGLACRPWFFYYLLDLTRLNFLPWTNNFNRFHKGPVAGPAFFFTFYQPFVEKAILNRSDVMPFNYIGSLCGYGVAKLANRFPLPSPVPRWWTFLVYLVLYIGLQWCASSFVGWIAFFMVASFAQLNMKFIFNSSPTAATGNFLVKLLPRNIAPIGIGYQILSWFWFVALAILVFAVWEPDWSRVLRAKIAGRYRRNRKRKRFRKDVNAIKGHHAVVRHVDLQDA